MAESKISFQQTTHDFGTVSESVGDITCEFKFTNAGNTPLLITRANASCGCTSPEYPRQPIRPGESGTIKVTYHAKGRPGPFEKSVYVYDNRDQKTMLIITGNVISDRTPADSYTIELGAGLRLKSRSLNFFDVYPNRANRTRTLQVYNDSKDPMQFTFRNLPKHIVVDCEPAVLQPKKEGKILITYYTDKVKDWGLCKDQFEVFVKGKESKNKDNVITVTADIWEDFSGLSRKERDNAPEIEVEGTQLDFGKCKTAKTMNVTIRNTGRTKLTIRKIQNEMPAVFATSLPQTVLKGGEAIQMKITFNPQECKMSDINHHLTIISNDPSNSRVIVNMVGSK